MAGAEADSDWAYIVDSQLQERLPPKLNPPTRDDIMALALC